MTTDAPPTAPLPSATARGWVTMYHCHVPGVGRVAIQKRDGETRSVPVGGR